MACNSTKKHKGGDRELLKSENKKMKTETTGYVTADINSVYDGRDFRAEIGVAFRNQQCLEQAESGVSLLNQPFACCVLPNFVKDDRFLTGLKDELLHLPFQEKSNDLYKFNQSNALQNFSSPHIQGLRQLLYEDFRSWLRDVTGISLNDTVDMTCSKYHYTDTLLCHDDELGGRRVAFILYLVPQWAEEDGGSLDLFSVDDHGLPNHVVKSLVPKWNTLVFFEVTPVSFHQVSEVLARDKCRLSVSGWFHGPRVPRPKPHVEPSMELRSHCTLEDTEIYEWINPLYLNAVNQAEIQDRFSEDSEIQLEDFFLPEKSACVSEALMNADIKWEKIGPANKRKYERADVTTLPRLLTDCLRLLQSEHVFLTLSNYTGLKLHENAPDNDSEDEDDGSMSSKDDKNGDGSRDPTMTGNPRCRAEIRRWTHGCYTLLHDTDTEGSKFALDAVIHFNRPSYWQTEHGGYTSYIAKAEDEELLSVTPENNALSLIYRDKETLRFVKHINDSFVECSGVSGDGPPVVHDIQLVYYE